MEVLPGKSSICDFIIRPAGLLPQTFKENNMFCHKSIQNNRKFNLLLILLSLWVSLAAENLRTDTKTGPANELDRASASGAEG